MIVAHTKQTSNSNKNNEKNGRALHWQRKVYIPVERWEHWKPNLYIKASVFFILFSHRVQPLCLHDEKFEKKRKKMYYERRNRVLAHNQKTCKYIKHISYATALKQNEMKKISPQTSTRNDKDSEGDTKTTLVNNSFR